MPTAIAQIYWQDIPQESFEVILMAELRANLSAMTPAGIEVSPVGLLDPGPPDNPPIGFVVSVSPTYHIVVGCDVERIQIAVETLEGERWGEYGYIQELQDPQSITNIEAAFQCHLNNKIGDLVD